MIAVKLSRLSGNLTHRDSLIDIAGYARTIEMTLHERAARAAPPVQVAAKLPPGTDTDGYY